MARKLSILDDVRVAAPCPASWAAMKGDERARFCGECRLHVFNLSDMTQEEAEALIRERTGRLCVRYYQRADGTILTADCPVGIWQIRRRFLKLIGGIAAAFALVAGGLHALARGERSSADLKLACFEPFRGTVAWLDGLVPKPSGMTKPSGMIWMGAIKFLGPTRTHELLDPRRTAEARQIEEAYELRERELDRAAAELSALLQPDLDSDSDVD